LIKEEQLLIEQYRIRKEIKTKPKTETKKIVTHEEQHNLLVKQCIDISDQLNFFSELPRAQLTRVKVNTVIKMSDEAQSDYQRLKRDVIALNHTDRPHNHLKFGCDVEHTVTERLELEGGAATNLLIA